MLDQVHILFALRDQRMARSMMREMDDGGRVTIQAVCDGLSAVDCCARFAPDILVIDAVLPGMDGPGVVDALHARMGVRAPRVIGGAALPMAREGFLRRGAHAVVDVPWRRAQLRETLMQELEAIGSRIDWTAAQSIYPQASALLEEMGMPPALKGFDYLCWAAALAYAQESRLYAVGERLYRPIAERLCTTPQSVERLIRHAVESTMNAAGARGVYHLFGNTIDPARGKPTNAQMIAMLVQRMKCERIRE